MKSMVKLFGIIAIVAVIGFGLTACDDKADDGFKIPTLPSTSGRLTISNLSSSYGEYFAAVHNGFTSLALCTGSSTDIGKSSPENVLVSSDTVTLYVWEERIDGNSNFSLHGYTGNDQNIQFSVYFYNSDGSSTNHQGTVTVNFTNGIATGAYVHSF